MNTKDLAVVEHIVRNANNKNNKCLTGCGTRKLTCGLIVEDDDDFISLVTEYSTDGKIKDGEFEPNRKKVIRIDRDNITQVNYYECW